MSNIPLSQFNSEGLAEFRKLLGRATGLKISEAQSQLLSLLTDSRYSIPIGKEVAVNVFEALETRQDTATETQRLISAAEIDATLHSGHDNVFAWIAAAFLPSLCKKTKSGSLDPGREYRYILSRSSTDIYRHLVACPFWLMKRYGSMARIFLCQKAAVMPDIVEQIISRPWLADSHGVIEAIDTLYWDKKENGPKPRFTSTETVEEAIPGYAKKPPVPGTLRALESVLGQLQCTYDLRSMSASDILTKLPNEFDEWR
jgi:hypothetical protein